MKMKWYIGIDGGGTKTEFLLRRENGTVLGKIRKEKYIMNQRKDYHIYTCPNCKQKIRIPKGKGKLNITCPKCHTEFVKNTGKKKKEEEKAS